jgi:hypothetical protein
MTIDTTYVKQAIKHYRGVELPTVEKLLYAWLDDTWSSSPYRDVLVPTLIQRKLELNEQEY